MNGGGWATVAAADTRSDDADEEAPVLMSAVPLLLWMPLPLPSSVPPASPPPSHAPPVDDGAFLVANDELTASASAVV